MVFRNQRSNIIIEPKKQFIFHHKVCIIDCTCHCNRYIILNRKYYELVANNKTTEIMSSKLHTLLFNRVQLFSFLVFYFIIIINIIFNYY